MIKDHTNLNFKIPQQQDQRIHQLPSSSHMTVKLATTLKTLMITSHFCNRCSLVAYQQLLYYKIQTIWASNTTELLFTKECKKPWVHLFTINSKVPTNFNSSQSLSGMHLKLYPNPISMTGLMFSSLKPYSTEMVIPSLKYLIMQAFLASLYTIRWMRLTSPENNLIGTDTQPSININIRMLAN